MDFLDQPHSHLSSLIRGSRIISPPALNPLLDSLPTASLKSQAHVLQQLTVVCRSLFHNSAVILAAAPLIHNRLVSLALESPSLADDVLSLIEVLVVNAGVRREHLAYIFDYVAHNRISVSALQLVLPTLTTLLKVPRSSDLLRYFYFNGIGAGLLLPPKDSFPFLNAISACIWLRIEETPSDCYSRLFTFHSAGLGGIELYFLGSKLFYRIVGPEYLPPKIAPGHFVTELDFEQWTHLALEHDKATSQLEVIINGEGVFNLSIDFLQVKRQAPLSSAVLFADFTGQVSAAMFFKESVSATKLKTYFSQFGIIGPQGHDSLRQLYRVVDKTSANNLALFFHPLRSASNVAYEGVSRSDAAFIGVAGAHTVPVSRMSYLGGICSLLPLLEKIKDASGFQSQLLLEWLKLLTTVLHERPENQLEATSLKIFKVMSEVFLQLPADAFTLEAVELIGSLCGSVKSVLQDQIAVHLLWCMELWHQTSVPVQTAVYQMLSGLYAQHPKTLFKVAGAARILDSLLLFYDSAESCCSVHGDSGRLAEVVAPIISIVELVFLTAGDSCITEVRHIALALSQPLQPCLQLSLLKLLQNLFTERPGNVIASPPQIFAIEFARANGMEILLHLLEAKHSDLQVAILEVLVLFIELVPQSMCTKRQLQVYVAQTLQVEPVPEQKLEEAFEELEISSSSDIQMPPPGPKGKKVVFEFDEESSPEPQIEESVPSPLNLRLSKPPVKRNFFELDIEDSQSDKDSEIELDLPPPKKNRGFKLFEEAVPDLQISGSASSSGPQAPSMKNTRKPNVKFSFDIEDEEEEDEPLELPFKSKPALLIEDASVPVFTGPPKAIKSFSSSRKVKIDLGGLCIDTETINSAYTFGGEKGELIREPNHFMKEINELAEECLKYQRGELKYQSAHKSYPLPPPSMQPQSVRGAKTIDFGETRRFKESTPIIEEASLDESGSVVGLCDLSLYRSLLSMTLKRQISDTCELVETDTLANIDSLSLLFAIVQEQDLSLKTRLLQDLLTLVTSNPDNATKLLSCAGWQRWLLDLLSKIQNDLTNDLTVSELGMRLHTLVVKQALLVDDQGWTYVRYLLIWLETKRDSFDSDSVQLVRQLLEELLSAVVSNAMGCRPSLASTFWKNLARIGFVLHEFILCNRPSSPKSSVPSEWQAACLSQLGAEWADESLIECYFQLLYSLWPSSMFQSSNSPLSSQGYSYLELPEAILRNTREANKQDATLLLYNSHNENGGCFLMTIVQLAILGVAGSIRPQSWLDTVERLFAFLLLSSESTRKPMPPALLRVYELSSQFILGSLCSLLEVAPTTSRQASLRKTLIEITKSLCSVFVLTSEYSRDAQKLSFVNQLLKTLATSSHNFFDEDRARQLFNNDFGDIEDLMDDDEWRTCLSAQGYLCYSEFLTVEAFKQILAARRAEAAEWLEADSISNVQEHVSLVSGDIAKSEELRRRTAEAYHEERARQRKEMWSRMKRLLTQGKTEEHGEYRKLAFSNWEGAMPFVKMTQISYSLIPSFTDENLHVLDEAQSRIGPAYETVYKIPEDSPLIKIIYSEPCELQRYAGWATSLSVRWGLLQVLDTRKEAKLRFVIDTASTQEKAGWIQEPPPVDRPCIKEWLLESLSNVLPRQFDFSDCAVEFFFKDGRSLFICFDSAVVRDEVLAAVMSCTRKNKRLSIPRLLPSAWPEPHKLLANTDLTDRWVNWQLSNFEYLMQLNYFAGRSLHDISRYPVFPWVISDHASTQLNLNLHDSFRDLSKPIAAQLGRVPIKSINGKPYNFDRFPSSAHHVLFLLRNLQPYSAIQTPHEFYSLEAAYEAACEGRGGELTPEFFSVPQVLSESIMLPVWASTAFDYIAVNREALESEYVSMHLNEWIDLIFGCKQQGEPALSVSNAYHPSYYSESFDIDPISERGLLDSVLSLGKVPAQLFSKPHPRRLPRTRLPPSTVVSREASLKIYLPVSRRALPRTSNLKSYFDLSDRAILKASFGSKNRIFAIRNNGSLVTYGWWPNSSGESKTPFTCTFERERHFTRDLTNADVETKDRSVPTLNAPIAIMSEGKILAQGGYWDGRLTIQRTAGNEKPTQIWNHYSTVTCIDFDDEEHCAITGSKDGDVLLWFVEGDYWKARWHYIDHTAPVTAVRISTQLRAFASASQDGTIVLYSLLKGRLLRVITLPEKPLISNFLFAPAAPSKIISFCPSQTSIWSHSVNGGLLMQIHERCSHVISPVLVRNLHWQEFIVYGTEAGEIVIRTVKNLQPLRRLALANCSPVLTLLVSEDLRFLLAGCADGELTVLTDPEAPNV
mmetsp:Transcript_20253/g.37790  ORF Transcript_20253/g.37790 Transcript_20253/m.37790 type:complete len:2300 (-) Transcript_20253:736-7635(-)